MDGFDNIGEILREHYKVFIILIVIIFIVLGIMISKSFWALMPEEGKARVERVSSLKFDSLMEIFEYYECKYKSTVYANQTGYEPMINASLRLPPSEGNIVNEEFYMSLLNDVALFLDYKNFIISDETRSLKVEVQCENAQIKKIIINGIENYFEQKKAELAERSYKEIKEVDITTNSMHIINAINNSWNSNQSFGTKDSMFNEYDIYFDEGIEVRKIQGKIYNIVFTEKYMDSVVNDIKTTDTLQNVRLKLGNPTFEDKGNGVIGYKGEDYYIFFGNKEISVYRNQSYDTDGLFKLLDEYRADERDLLDFMNQLTYLWPDYNEYDYNASSVYISYALKGFEIKINYENERGFIFYNNINAHESKIRNYLDSDDYKAYLQTDSVFKAEVARRIKNRDMKSNIYVFNENYYQNSTYDIYLEKTNEEEIVKVYFISKDNSKLNRELNDSINTFGWISDNYFVFSKETKGLYCFDLNTGDITTLISDKKKFEITSTGDAYIVYDGVEQRFEF